MLCLYYLVSVWGRRDRDGIFKPLKWPRNRSKESIPTVYVAWRAVYDNPIPTWFLAPIDCPKKVGGTRKVSGSKGGKR